MKIVKNNPVIIDLNVGDSIGIYGHCEAGIYGLIKTTVVRRIVENCHGTYVVLNDGTWRPMSTYGETWVKLTTYTPISW